MRSLIFFFLTTAIFCSRLNAMDLDSTGRKKEGLYFGYTYWSGIEYAYDEHASVFYKNLESAYSINRHNLDVGVNFKIWRHLFFQFNTGGFYSNNVRNISLKGNLGYSFHNFNIGLGYRSYEYIKKNVDIIYQGEKYRVDQIEEGNLGSIDFGYFLNFKKIQIMLGLDLPIAVTKGDGGRFYFSSESSMPIELINFGMYPTIQFLKTFNFRLQIKLL